MRVTQRQLTKRVEFLAKVTGLDLVIDWSYGRPRIGIADGTGIGRWLTNRDRIGLVDQQLEAMIELAFQLRDE